MTEKKKKQTEVDAYPGEVLSRDTSAEGDPGSEPVTAGPAPTAVEKFDALMAEETRRMPAPPRTLAPFDAEKLVRGRIVLPAGASLEFKTGLLVFRIPPDEERDHVVEVAIRAGDRTTAGAALDAAIRAAEPAKTRCHEGAEFFLHAVQYSHPSSTQIFLRYVFRQRPSEALSGEEVRNA